MSNEKKPSRMPDYRVAALRKNLDTAKGSIGVAWRNEDGSISVTVNPFVRLDNADGDLLLTLFPAEAKWKPKAVPKFTGPVEAEDNDRIPF